MHFLKILSLTESDCFLKMVVTKLGVVMVPENVCDIMVDQLFFYLNEHCLHQYWFIKIVCLCSSRNEKIRKV